MKKLLLCCLGFLTCLYPQMPYVSTQSLASSFYSRFDSFRIHSRSLFARSGELRGNVLENGVWINEEFGFLGHRDVGDAIHSRESYNNFSFGADTFFTLPQARLYFGGGIDVVAGKGDCNLYQNTRGSYALGAYITYFHRSQFFFDLNAKYFYSTQNIIFQNSHLADSVYGEGSHNFYLALNIGQRLDTSFSPFLPNFFFLEPSLTLETGYLPAQRETLRDGSRGEMRGFAPLGIKANLAFGKEWNGQYSGALKGGISLEYDWKINGEISLWDGVGEANTLKPRNDFRLGMFIEADFILNRNFRFFVRTNSTFLGKLNTIYAMNLGMRFSFGSFTQHKLHSQKNVDWKSGELQ